MHAVWQPPPEQSMLHVLPSRQVNEQPPCEQSKLHDSPAAHCCPPSPPPSATSPMPGGPPLTAGATTGRACDWATQAAANKARATNSFDMQSRSHEVATRLTQVKASIYVGSTTLTASAATMGHGVGDGLRVRRRARTRRRRRREASEQRAMNFVIDDRIHQRSFRDLGEQRIAATNASPRPCCE